ncbi:hypothetical protein EV361DRAFT_935282 [Lentinula raphanica]|uniref:Uncharacterized protein n=1 Tax=Lentinula raphanica TaxID=153919 RepID=A0AA38NX50_9AGAR|nr:hypothetical protein F5880DRAFT_1010942 [Lentinula raphanica]KAJ3832254.1 hypothetical protein F5878DRAFT_18453 [Lentinula raphanica]KAJ3966421.1 hypothetical protein EV361DRAFT_935282 [Lentinula raphanica]
MRMRLNPVHVFILLLVSGVLGKPILGRKKEPKPIPYISYTFAPGYGSIESNSERPKELFDEMAKGLVNDLFKVGLNAEVQTATEEEFVGSSTVITSPRKIPSSDKMSPEQFTLQFNVPSTSVLEKLGNGPFRGGARAGVFKEKIDPETIEGVLQDADGKNVFEVREGEATTAKTTSHTAGRST